MAVGHYTRLAVGYISVILAAALGLSCEEELPPFEDPTNTIKPGVLRTRYIFVIDDNSMEITLTVRHQYDETLEGVTNLDGSVTITSVRSPSVQRTLNFNYTSLASYRNYNTSTKVLRFDPGDTLTFRMRWDFVDQNGDSLKNFFFRYFVDPDCRFRCIADEEVFVLTANLRLFDNVPVASYGPELASLCYVSTWVDRAVCPPINTSSPCSYFPGTSARCDSGGN